MPVVHSPTTITAITFATVDPLYIADITTTGSSPGIPRNTGIFIEFNVAVNNVASDDTSWYTFTCGDSDTPHPLQTTTGTEPTQTQFTLEPPVDNLLPAGAMCTFTIVTPDQITTPDGRTLTCDVDSPCTHSFTVDSASIPPPMLDSSDPAHDATDVAINSDIHLNFNTAVSAPDTAFSLTCGSDPDPVVTVTFTRTSPDTPDTIHTLESRHRPACRHNLYPYHQPCTSHQCQRRTPQRYYPHQLYDC